MSKTAVKTKTNTDYSMCIECFKSLGVLSCMKMYQYLRQNGKATVKTLTNFVKLTQPTVSYHLKEMKDNGILISHKVGKEVYYEVNTHCKSSDHECVVAKIEFPALERKN